MPSTSTWGRTEPFRYPTPHPPNPESGAHSPTRFGASSAKMHPTSLIPFDFRQDKWANPATRFGIGSAPRTEQRARQKMRYGSLTYDPSGRLCVRLLIRRSLVGAQVGEPKNLFAVLAFSQSSGVGFLHSGDRHTFSPALAIKTIRKICQESSARNTRTVS